VAVVARVLLDHVQVDPADRARRPAVVERAVQVSVRRGGADVGDGLFISGEDGPGVGRGDVVEVTGPGNPAVREPQRAGFRLNGMRNGPRITTGLLVTALAAAGCGPALASRPQPPPVLSRGVAAREPAADPRPYGAADTAFGLAVLRTWCQADPRGNLVLSPVSLATGLGMAYLGARGSTARAMAGVLRLPSAGGRALAAGLQARSAALRGLDSPGVTVAGRDQVWADPSLRTRPGYLNAVATGYGAGVRRVPLLRSPDLAAQEIDQAIAAATRGQIPRLLTPGSLQGIGWVLTDALYLHAAWAAPFQASQTRPGPFAAADGRRVSVKFLHGGDFRTARAGGWTAVSLPYRGGKLAMVALLPAAAGRCPLPGPGALGTITARLAAATTAAGGGRAGVALPKVNLSSRASLKGLLSGLGMGVAFSPAADFSALSPQACCIALVKQAATLRVGEKGTVASAATAVGLAPTAMQVQPPQIVFDRPYLLLVTDTVTGEPLFLARVADPAAP
jgi:serpin B